MPDREKVFFSTFAIVYMFLTVSAILKFGIFSIEKRNLPNDYLICLFRRMFSHVLCKQKFFCFCLKLNGRSNKVFFYSTFAIVYMFLTVCAISSVSYLNRCNGAFQATADSRQISSFKARKFSLDKVNK